MKPIFTLLVFVFSFAGFSQSLCTDLNFEQIAPGVYTGPAIPNWSIESQTMTAQFATTCISPTVWTGGSNEFNLGVTPYFGLPGINILPNSPLGGSVVAVLNNTVNNSYSTKLSRTFSVSPANPYLTYALAFVAQVCSHDCCQKPRIEINFKNAGGNIISCISQTIVPECASNTTINSTYAYSGWQTYSVNLTTQPSTLVTMEVIARDCNYSGHYGFCFFDAVCSASGPSLNINYSSQDNFQRVSWCAGTSSAYISVPPGMTNYTWSIPATASVVPSSLTSTLLAITNPSPNSTYTLTSLSSQGCLAATVYTLVYTSLTLGLNLTSYACGTSANGGATIQATGSSAGYNATWYSGSVNIGTGLSNSTLTSGTYSVVITTSAAGCGSASTSFFVPAHNYQITPNASVFGLCSGQNTIVTINTSPALNTSNASFSWSPSAFLLTNTSTSTFFTPSIAVGASLSTIYTVVVTPTIAPQCAFSTTFMVNLSNPLQPTLSVPPQICSNAGTVQITANPAYQGTFVANPNNCMSSAGVFSPTAVSSGSCSFTYVFSSAGCSRSIYDTIVLLSSPNISISGVPTNICQGQTATLTASGASQYTWNNSSPGPTFVSSPQVSTIVTVTGSYSNTCTDTKSVSLIVSPSPTISVSPSSMCLKSPATFTAMGANTYSWSNGAIGNTMQPVVSPGVNTVFITGTVSATQCTNVSLHTYTVYNPAVSLGGDTLVCTGAPYTFTAGGCSSYTWNSTASGSSYTGFSNSAQVLTVQVSGESNGCIANNAALVRVDACSGIEETHTNAIADFFPNPSSGSVKFISVKSGELFVWDTGGRCIMHRNVEASKEEAIVLPPGIYFAGFMCAGTWTYQRLIVLSEE